MKWQPITNLPNEWNKLLNPELKSLVTVWEEQAGRLRDSGAFKSYMSRLQREIAIETGIIERLYSLDRGVTHALIEQGIDEALIPHGTTNRPVGQVVALIKDQETVIEDLFDFVGGQRELSTSYIKQLHQNNPMRPDGPIHEYAPPEQVDSEMDNLIKWHLEHEELGVSPEIEAAWLHHRFTQIHPFQDGNGRIARLLASLVFIKAKWFPLILTRDDKSNYIAVLEEADHGNLAPLVDLFANRQKRAFIRSLGLSEEILAKARRTQAIISSIADKLRRDIDKSEQEKIQQVEAFANILFQVANDRLQEISDEIRLSVVNLIGNAQIFVSNASANGEKSHYYRYQVIETAKQLDYYANLRNYHSWIQLVIDVERPTMILISFHVLGYEYYGLLACSACAYHRDLTDDDDKNVSEVQTLTDIPFQFSYADQQENLVGRYKQWLETAIVSGLEYWNKSL